MTAGCSKRPPTWISWSTLFAAMNKGRKRARPISSEKSSATKVIKSGDCGMNKEGMSWTFHSDEKVYAGIYGDWKPSEKVACFDFDGTLSVTRTGKTFPVDASDCRLMSKALPSIIKSYHDSGFAFVVFTNQSGVFYNKTTIEAVKNRIYLILEAIGVPCIAFACVYENAYRKPRRGMMDLFLTHYNGGKEVSLKDSFFVGDAAGRPKTADRTKDHSDADYFFALNTGLPFILPEQFISKQDISKASKHNHQTLPNNRFHPKSLIPSENSTTHELISGKKLPFKELSSAIEDNRKGRKTLLVVMVGIAGSGKSTLARKILSKATIISRDLLGTMNKVEAELKKLIEERCPTIVVDNTNTKKEERQKWIKHAKNNSVSLVAIHADVSLDNCLHNNTFRRLRLLQSEPETDVKKISSVPTFVIKNMEKNLEIPSAEEGFSAVYKVKFVPEFSCEADEKLYNQYLLF